MPDDPDKTQDPVPPWQRRGAAYLALTTVAVAQPLLQIYGENLAVFTAAHFSGAIVVWFALFVLLVPPLLLLCIDVVLVRVARVPARRVHASLVWIGSWAVVSLFLRGVSTGSWVVDSAVTYVLAGLVVRTYMRHDSVRSWVSYVSIVSLVVAVLFAQAAMPIINPPAATTTPVSPSTPRPTASIVWIVLDEAPLFPLMGTDGTINADRFPGFAALGSQSTWYRNVVATSQKTTDAVPAMLEGRWPTGGQPILGDHPRNLFTALGGSMEMDVSEAVTAMCPDAVCVPHGSSSSPTDASPVTERVPFPSFLRDASVVVGHKLLPEGLRSRLPAIDEGWGEFGAGAEKDAETTTATPGSTEAPRSGHAGRVQTLERLTDNAATSTSPTLHFAHVLLPHKPWTLAPDLRMSARPDNDPRPVTNLDRRRDAYQSHLRQYVAVDSVIGGLVRKLKASGRWDSTMIVVTADHGLTFVPGESYRDVVNVGNPQTLDDIYRVPLFVKYPGQSAGRIDDCPVSSVDILPTVLAAVGVETGWGFDGADLAASCPHRPVRTVRWPKGRFDLTTGVAELRDRVAYYGKWVDADGDASDIVRGGLSGSLVGSRVPDNPERETAVSWTVANRSAFDSVGEGRFASVPTRAFGTVRTSRTIDRSTEGVVEVDGVFVGVVSELAGLAAGSSSYFVAPVETSLLSGAGAHSVRLWTATWAGGSVSLRRVG